MSLLIVYYKAEWLSLILRYSSSSPMQAYGIAENDNCSQLVNYV